MTVPARVLVLGGTTEGRQATVRLLGDGFSVLFTSTTEFAASELLEQVSDLGFSRRLVARPGALALDELTRLARETGVSALVDATHPFANQVTANARQATVTLGIPYVRLTRPPVAPPPSREVVTVGSYEEAAATACSLGRTILLTVGSRHLASFVKEANRAGCRLIARVLPEPSILSSSLALGLTQDQIIAARGPFSIAFNLGCLRQFNAEVMVSKDSGEAGGTVEKIRAARQAGVPLVLIEARIEADAVVSYEGLRSRLSEFGVSP